MAEKSITVKEFVDKYNRAKNKETFIDRYLKAEVPGVQEKMFWQDKIVKTAHMTEDGRYVQNLITERVLAVLTIVRLYTVVEVDFTNMESEFDLLENSGLLKRIYEVVATRESDNVLMDFDTYVDYKRDDLRTNYCEPHAFVYDQITRFGELIGNALAPAIENLDVDQVTNALQNVIKG